MGSPSATAEGHSRAGTASPAGPDAVTWLTFYLVLLYAIPSRLVIGPLGSAGSISMLAGLASFGVWAVAMVWRTEPAQMRPRPLRIALGVFALCVGVSYVLAMSKPVSGDEISPADVALISLVSWSGTLLLTHDLVPNRRRLDALVRRLALCGGLMALLGIVQFLAKVPLVDHIAIPGLTEVASADIYIRNGLVRPAGTALHPIEYGALLSMLLPLATHVGFHERSWPPALRWFPAFAIGTVIAISSSRSAYLGAAIGLAICLFGWTRKHRRVILAAAALGVVLLSAAVPRLLVSVTNLFAGAGNDSSITSRTDSFGFAWDFITANPLFGRGLGTFLPKYRIFDNQYLGLLVSIGIVGTLALLGLAGAAVAQLVGKFRASSDDSTRDFAVSMIAAVVTGFVNLAFFDAFAFPMTMGTLFLVLGLSGALGRMARDDRVPDTP